MTCVCKHLQGRLGVFPQPAAIVDLLLLLPLLLLLVLLLLLLSAVCCAGMPAGIRYVPGLSDAGE
jgi:hypothetical protein